MNITKPAATAILHEMSKAGLDIHKFAVSFDFVDGGVGLSFRNDKFGKEYHFHGLRVVVDGRINTDGMLVDFKEVNGKVGLIFTGEQNGSIIERKSSEGSQASA